MSNEIEAILGQAKWVLRVVLKRRWLAFGVAAGVAVVAGVGIPYVPERFEAKARVYVDTMTVLKPLMVGLTYQPNIDQQVEMLARTLISRPNVERLASTAALGLDASNPSAREREVSRLMEQIKVAPTGSENLYEITYRGPSPEGARRLVEATLDMFVNAGTRTKKRDSEAAGRFIDEQIRGYEAKLVEAESRLKDFKVRNFGVSGVSDKDYFARISALSDEVSKLRTDLGAAENSRDSYRRELAAEDPQLPPELAPKFDGAVPDADARLSAQRKRLDELLSRYTDEHPDVVSARRIVAQLEAEARERKEAEAHGASKTGKAATSPVYQKLRVSLVEAEAQVASLRSQLAAQQRLLDQARAEAGRLPQVEAELAQLNRDYDIIRKNYDVMVARRESASLGMKLDETSQLADFRVIDPPRVSPTPVFPGRLHLALISIVLSLAAGVGAAVAAEAMRPTISDLKSLRLLSSRPSLGAVTLVVTPESQRLQRKGMMRFTAAFIALIAFQAVWAAWIALHQRLG